MMVPSALAHCYGAATFVFGVWASGMDADGTLHWALPDKRKSYYDEEYLPKKLDRGTARQSVLRWQHLP